MTLLLTILVIAATYVLACLLLSGLARATDGLGPASSTERRRALRR